MLNNSISNLRWATRSEQCANQKRKGSNLKGVQQQGEKFRANIRINGKNTYLGMFKTEEEAHKAYCKKAKEVFGDFFNTG